MHFHIGLLINTIIWWRSKCKSPLVSEDQILPVIIILIQQPATKRLQCRLFNNQMNNKPLCSPNEDQYPPIFHHQQEQERVGTSRCAFRTGHFGHLKRRADRHLAPVSQSPSCCFAKVRTSSPLQVSRVSLNTIASDGPLESDVSSHMLLLYQLWVSLVAVVLGFHSNFSCGY